MPHKDPEKRKAYHSEYHKKWLERKKVLFEQNPKLKEEDSARRRAYKKKKMEDPDFRKNANAISNASRTKRRKEDPALYARDVATWKQSHDRYCAGVQHVINDFRASGCVRCGEKMGCCLVAHHVDPKTKLFNIGSTKQGRFSLDSIRAELKKCVCVCGNCHRKIHAGLMLVTPDRVVVDKPEGEPVRPLYFGGRPREWPLLVAQTNAI